MSLPKVGIEVILKDMTQEAADKGKAYSEALVNKAVKRGKMFQSQADTLIRAHYAHRER